MIVWFSLLDKEVKVLDCFLGQPRLNVFLKTDSK